MSPRPTTAMVLAAGLGTRMRPLTDSLPKPMVPLGGRPLIDHVLDRLLDAGIRRAVVNVHYLADTLEAHLARRREPAIEISDERGVLLDTGGGVVRALPKLGDGPFLIHNSDSVWMEGVGSNIARLIDAWDDATMDALMLVAGTSHCLGYDGKGDFEMAAGGRLRRRDKGGTAPLVFAGVSIAHPRLFAGSPHGAFSLNEPWDRAIGDGRLFGVRLEGLWMHVGTPEALMEAERIMASEDAD